jgi:hypothetical protein
MRSESGRATDSATPKSIQASATALIRRIRKISEYSSALCFTQPCLPCDLVLFQAYRGFRGSSVGNILELIKLGWLP